MRGLWRMVLRGLWVLLAIGYAETAAFGQYSTGSYYGGGQAQAVPGGYSVQGGVGGQPGTYTVQAGVGGMGMGMVGGASGGPLNAMNNPFMGPMLYSTMNSVTPNQLTSMIAANQFAMMGFGSGQMGGGQPGGLSAQATAARMAATAQRHGGTRTPGGLAARYFNRRQPNSSYPRTYFNRGTGYYPDSKH